MTAFEIQVDPERNALLRRALAKRIARQRELDEEEASTEEDESFLGGTVPIAHRKVPGILLVSKKDLQLRHSHHQRQLSTATRASEEGSKGSIHDTTQNAKSRWKTEYLRSTTSSPSAKSVVSESVYGPDTLPGVVPDNVSDIVLDGPGRNDDPEADPPSSTGNLKTLPSTQDQQTPVVNMAPDQDPVESIEPPVRATTSESEPAIMTQDPSSETTITTKVDTKDASTAPLATVPVVAGADEPDSMELEILEKLEELRKEKSRLFALFRASLMRRELEIQEQSRSRSGTPSSTIGAAVDYEEMTKEGMIKQGRSEDSTTTAMNVFMDMDGVGSAGAKTDSRHFQSQKSHERQAHRGGVGMMTASVEETKDGVSPPRKQRNSDPAPIPLGGGSLRTKRPSDQDHERRAGSSNESRNLSGGKRREHDRVIDRSKLNLEIPRKPSITSVPSSSSSSASTPTTSGFGPPSASSSAGSSAQRSKRQRSLSPPMFPGASSTAPTGAAVTTTTTTSTSGGPSNSGSYYFGSHGPYPDSLPASSKYPRADHMAGPQAMTNSGNARHRGNGMGGGGGPGGGMGTGGPNHLPIGHSSLPEKPQVRYHGASAISAGGRQHGGGGSGGSSSGKPGRDGPSGGSTGAGGYQGDDGYSRGKPSLGSSSSGPNGAGNGGSGGIGGSSGGPPYRVPGGLPSRIGFGPGSGGSGGGGGGGGSGGGRGGGGDGGRGGGGGGGPLLGPHGRSLPFSRSMMLMPHARGGPFPARPRFGGGGGLDRNQSSSSSSSASAAPGRPDWGRRRSRA